MRFKFPWKKIQLIKVCRELVDLKLWEYCYNLDFFVVETPLEKPLVVSILGSGGEDYGLTTFRSPEPFKQAKIVVAQKKYDIDKISVIGFSMIHYKDMRYEEKKWYKSCNYRTQKSDWLPSTLSKRHGEMTGLVESDYDIDLLTYIVKGIIKVHKNGEFHPEIQPNGDSKIFTIEVSGNTEDPDVKVSHKSFSGSGELLQMCRSEMVIDDFSDVLDISKLPKLKENWVIVPVYVTNEDGSGENCIFVIAEEKSHYILHTDVIKMDIGKAFKILAGAFSGDNMAERVGVPQKMIITEKKLFEALEIIKPRDIDICYDAKHPVAKDIRKSIAEDLPVFVKKHVVKHLKTPDIDLAVVPADDDLESWKIIQKMLTNQFINFWHDSDYLREIRPSKKFFGDDDWEYFIDEYEEVEALPSYVNWAALTYRRTKNAQTFVEKLLAEDIPEPLKISLESLNNSYPSLYQITEADAETGHVVLRDLLLSKTVTVHDQVLSETPVAGLVTAFWVYSVGNFNFVNVAGPIFYALSTMDVMEMLLELKLPEQPTAKWLRENAHIFGRLWDLYDEISTFDSTLPQLANTDGQLLEFITAYFECSNMKKVCKSLLQKEDIDYDKDEDVYIWFKDNPDSPMMGRTLLARLFLQGNKIIAETNSKARLDSLISMFGHIGDIRYLRHQSKDVEEMLKEAPEKNEDVVEEILPEKLKAAAQEHINRYYMDWLDKPNPSLGNKTPRQAAKDKRTSQKTRILIETIPAPMANNGINIPKKEMLKSLGFGEKPDTLP